MIKEKLSLTPTKPGCYLMKNQDNQIIYVGKAKNLKNRLKSYFNGSHTGKTAALVANIYDFEYIVTNNETESFILEINLIKKYSPKYNILLKDDKTYPYIELTNEEYPKLNIIRTKNKRKNKNKLFGPYPNVWSARKVVDVINRIYPLRKCKTLKKNVCLYYHIGECLGYCKYNIDQKRIKQMYDEISDFLSGNNQHIINEIKQEISIASENLNYEKAKELKIMMDDIIKISTKQIIDSNAKYNFDVFGYYIDNGFISIQVLFIRNGVVFERHYDIYENAPDINDFMMRYIAQFYNNYCLPKEIIVNEGIDINVLNEVLKTSIIVPQKGNIRKILDMANMNSKTYLEEKIELIKLDDNKRCAAKKTLENLLNVGDITRIEMFDNSHLFGTYYVSGCVVFDNFIPNKKEYRKYKIQTEEKNDLSAMKEVFYRRYYRMLMEDASFPDLIIVDGGKTQLCAAKEILDSLNIKVKLIGLAKDDHHKTDIIINDDLAEISIKEYPDLYVFLLKIQEEVHRFAITYHRNIYSKGSLTSILETISGIGDKRKKLLLKKYGSLTKMKEASIEELKQILPEDIAINFYEGLKNI